MRVGVLGSLARIAGPIAAVFAGTAVAGFLKDTVDSASNLNETVNKSNAIFGASAGTINRWAEGSVKSVGLSKAAALDAAASFGNMFTQIGFSSAEAAKLSTSVVTLSADLGSFNNLPTADVADRIQAAFRGEYDSLQALIPNINAARVAQVAMATTGKTTADALTAQEKAAAVLAIVEKDGAKASGDWAKTSGDLAGQQKQLSENFDNLKAKIGQALIPAFNSAATTINTKVFPALGQLGDKLSSLKDSLPAGTFDSLGTLGDKLSTSFGGVKTFFESFGPTLQSFADNFTGVLGPGLTDISNLISETLLPAFDEFLPAIQPIADFIVETFGGAITGALNGAINVVKGAIKIIAGVMKVVTGVLTGDWSKAWDGIKGIFSGAWDVLKGLVQVWFSVGLPRLLGKGIGLAKTAVGKGWDKIKELFQLGVDKIKTFVSELAGKLWTLFKTALGRAKDAVVDGIGKVITYFKEFPGRVVRGLGNIGRLLYDKGKAIVEGLLDGIRSIAGKVKDTLLGLLPGPLQKFAKTLGISSPSAVFAGYGRDIGQGLVVGVESQRRAVEQAVAMLAVQPPALRLSDVTAGSALPGARAGGSHVTVVQNFPPPLPERAIRHAIGDALALAGR